MFGNRVKSYERATMGNLRAQDCRSLVVSCISEWCQHSETVDPDWLPDDVSVRSLGPVMVCTACGTIGADVRPDWSSGYPVLPLQ
jgi:hypothetical protein